MIQGEYYLKNLQWSLYAHLQTDGTISATELKPTNQQKWEFKEQAGGSHTISVTDYQGNKAFAFADGITVKCETDQTFFWTLKAKDNKIYTIYYGDTAWDLIQEDRLIVKMKKYNDTKSQQWEFVKV